MMGEDVSDKLIEFFDKDYYVRAYPDIEDWDPLRHYIEHGWRENRRPNPWFGTGYIYSSADPAVPAFVGFLTNHSIEQIRRLAARYAHSEPGHQECVDCDAMRAEFDAQYYRSQNLDVQDVPDALAHYCEHGWKERRNPNRDFDVGYYLDIYEDIRSANINPFAHFILYGRQEGRKPRDPLRHEKRILVRLKTPRMKTQELFGGRSLVSGKSVSDLFQALAAEAGEGFDRELVVSLSHDDAFKANGGIQLVIRKERRRENRKKNIHLHLHPTFPQMRLAPSLGADRFFAEVTLGPDKFGPLRLTEIMWAIGAVFPGKEAGVTFRLHSLLGWNLDDLAKEILELRRRRPTAVEFIGHDYFSLCENWTLLRNDVAFCGAPAPLGSAEEGNEIDGRLPAQCRVCAYGRDRLGHLQQMQRFFETVAPDIEFVSEVSADLLRSYGFIGRRDHHVKPHALLQPRDGNCDEVRASDVFLKELLAPVTQAEPVKVAFCGTASAGKGLYHFLELVESRAVPGKAIAYYQFSDPKPEHPSITHVPTDLSSEESALPELLVRHGIDVAVLPSIWPETFGFTMVECVEAGVPILTLESSGNIAATVRAHELGWSFPSIREMGHFLAHPDLRGRLSAARRRISRFKVTSTLDVVDEGSAT